MSTDLVRWAKLAGVAGIALHMSLAAFGNVTDYDSNCRHRDGVRGGAGVTGYTSSTR